MGNKIEKTTTIKIVGLPIIFYKMENADIFIDTQNIDKVFGIPLDHKIPFITLYDDALTKKEVLAYPIDVIVDNLSEDRLRYFAKMGIVQFMDSSSDKKDAKEAKETIESIEPEQPELSDFDKLLKTALDYNPKSK